MTVWGAPFYRKLEWPQELRGSARLMKLIEMIKVCNSLKALVTFLFFYCKKTNLEFRE